VYYQPLTLAENDLKRSKTLKTRNEHQN